MAQPTAQPGEINHGPLDRFTVVHFATGYAAGLLGASWPLALALGIAWEVVERPLKDRFPGLFPHATQDTLVNATTDVLAFTAGAALARGGR